MACIILLLFPVLLSSCSNFGNGGIYMAPKATPQWVVGWGASPQNALTTPTNTGGSEQSFRFIVVPTIGGNRERVRFSNYFGTTAITIGSARVAIALGSGPAIDKAHDAALTFSGNQSVTIQPNQEVYSDPVDIAYTYGQKLAVSVYMQGSFPALTEHDSQAGTNFTTAVGAGNTTNDSTGASFTETTTEWFLITNVDVYGPYDGTVAVFGSSSVDGHNSNFGDTNSYPVGNGPVAGQDHERPSDWLGNSLNEAGIPVGVLNAGLLGDFAGEEDNPPATAGIDRIDHDVLQQPGIKAVVIYIGGVDLRIGCLPATTVAGTLTAIVAKAHAAGVRVILATLPPSEYCTTGSPLPSSDDPYAGDNNPGPENPGSTQRRALNTWIRNSGSQLPGVVSIADFDAALADPAHPDFMIPNLNSGDNFHPNGAGYGAQNSAIDITAILGN
jgi:lysophospholipase L1-like esterase